MGDRANVIVVRENGAHELYRTGWAVGIDLDLLEGPAPVLAMLPELRQDGWWLDDTMAQGGILLDLGRKVLLFFAWEGPSTELRHRATTFELIRAAWPGWTVEFWQDDWERHVRACDRFSPAAFDAGEEARATVLAEAAERLALRARHRAQVARPRTAGCCQECGEEPFPGAVHGPLEQPFVKRPGKSRARPAGPARASWCGICARWPPGIRRWSAHRGSRAGSAGIDGSIRFHVAPVITHRTDASDRPKSRSRRHAPGPRPGGPSQREVVRRFQSSLTEAIERADVGEFDGNEYGGGKVVLYAYGPDADALFAVIAPILNDLPFRPAHVVLRYGSVDDPSAAEHRVDL